MSQETIRIGATTRVSVRRRLRLIAGMALIAAFGEAAASGHDDPMLAYSSALMMYLAGFYALQLSVSLLILIRQWWAVSAKAAALGFLRSLATLPVYLLIVWLLATMLPDGAVWVFLGAVVVLPPVLWYLSYKV